MAGEVNMWVVVIKKMNSDDPAIVIRRSRLKSVADYINAHIRTRYLVDWDEAMIEVVKRDYRSIPTKKLAHRLTEMSGQEVSKNALISKARALGLCRPKTAKELERVRNGI